MLLVDGHDAMVLLLIGVHSIGVDCTVSTAINIIML